MNETKKYLDYNGLETLVNIIKGTYAEASRIQYNLYQRTYIRDYPKSDRPHQ